MGKFQIGIMGSAADLNYGKEPENFAKELGKEVALSGNILVYGAEKEYSSLSTMAAMEADKYGGMTLGITGGKEKEVYGDFRPTMLVPTGSGIGGGREFTLILSCDSIIAIGGGSGTLTEIAIAYQANIPIVTIDKFDGWAKELVDRYLDQRNRLKCERASDPKEAVEKAIQLVKKRR